MPGQNSIQKADRNRSIYQNPVWPGYFADPYVLNTGGRYYAYGTGAAPLHADGKAFEILESDDLIHWKSLGGALNPIRGGHAYWAPEVVEHNGKFYLFCSAGDGRSDATHRLRVALGTGPTGPFTDMGRELLTGQGFSIDPNPFRDPVTGKWYLYFGTDFTEDQPFGTGLSVVPLADDLLSATAAATPVLRASQEWQVYECNRDYKGRIWPIWNTVEGPFVVYRDRHYWLFYSGGRWSGDRYGVGAAVAEHPLGPFKDVTKMGAPSVLNARPGQVIGPGHNSVVIAPDQKTTVAVYHAWNLERTLRQMRIDPLVWTPQGPVCDGPSVGPRNLYELALPQSVAD